MRPVCVLEWHWDKYLLSQCSCKMVTGSQVVKTLKIQATITKKEAWQILPEYLHQDYTHSLHLPSSIFPNQRAHLLLELNNRTTSKLFFMTRLDGNLHVSENNKILPPIRAWKTRLSVLNVQILLQQCNYIRISNQAPPLLTLYLKRGAWHTKHSWMMN